MTAVPRATDETLIDKPSPLVDLALTLPIFVAYHIAVVFMKVRNATDWVTGLLLRLVENDKSIYLGVTLAIGIVFALAFTVAGRGQAFAPRKFVQVAFEGVAYAVMMRVVGAQVVGRLLASVLKDDNAVVQFVMSLGAGFYEELAFRVVLFACGAKLLVWTFASERVAVVGVGRPARLSLVAVAITLVWALASAAIFSGVHYIGPLGDKFELASFTFRAVLGLMLTLIFVFRGFAVAVWAHALYDIWVLL